MNKIYVMNSKRIRTLLKAFVKNFDTIENTSKFLKTRGYNLQRWVRGKRSVPLEIIEIVSRYNKSDIWKLLEKERIKSETGDNNFKINYEPTKAECMLIGWILTDGHLGKTSPVSISQKSKETLKELKSIIEDTFDFRKIAIYPDKNSWKLKIHSIAFREYLKLRYNLPSGKKADIIEVPSLFLMLRWSINGPLSQAVLKGMVLLAHLLERH